MKKFKAVSVDMFGTLVDVNSVRHTVWRAFLGERYTSELADQYWNRASDMLFQHIEESVIRDRKYTPPKEIFEMMYCRLFAEIGIDFEPKEGARVLAHQHSFSGPFQDSLSFLNAVGREYPVCLSSDTDEEMLGPLRDLYPFDNVVTSEEIGAYKV